MGIHPYVEQDRDYLIALRRHFHCHPELSMQEHRTAQRIEEELRSVGIPTRRVGDTGVLGVLRGGRGDGRKIVLRADIDALPIQDGKAVPYASQESGVMHACGHDVHAAALIGAWIATNLDVEVLRKPFGIYLLLSGVSLLWPDSKKRT